MPFVAIAASAVVVSLWIPPVYESEGTILIESQQIPDDLIRSTVTSYADERIQVIQQLVMTRENLLRIIEKYDVFGERRQDLTVSEQVDLMRQRISIKTVAGDVSRRRSRTTIAFTVGYEDPAAQRAFAVANELVTLFLEENVKTRTARASETTDFLSSEADRLKRALEEIEEQIANYKQEYGDALPEHLDLHMSMLERTEAAIKQAELDVKAARDSYRFLEIERSAITSGLAASGDPEARLSPSQELARAEAELTRLRGRYTAQHPALRRQVALVERLRAAQAEPPGESEGEGDAADPGASGESAEGAAAALPSGSIELARVEARMNSVNDRIDALEQRVAQLTERRSELEGIIIQTPQVQRALTSLTRDYENTLKKYKEIQGKEMEARLAESLEAGRKAERFSLIEPPVKPDRPTKPNRRKIALLGTVLAGAAAGAFVVLLEMLDHRVRGANAVTRLFGDRPLVSIPYIVTTAEQRRRRRLQWGAAGGTVVAGVLLLLGMHLFYLPLDMLAIKVMARLG